MNSVCSVAHFQSPIPALAIQLTARWRQILEFICDFRAEAGTEISEFRVRRRGCVVSKGRTVVDRERFLSPWGAQDVGNSQAGMHGAVTLEQLIALGDEMAALVKAGVPLEEGLTEFARDMPGQPGKLAKMLGERMSAGKACRRSWPASRIDFRPSGGPSSKRA